MERNQQRILSKVGAGDGEYIYHWACGLSGTIEWRPDRDDPDEVYECGIALGRDAEAGRWPPKLNIAGHGQTEATPSPRKEQNTYKARESWKKRTAISLLLATGLAATGAAGLVIGNDSPNAKGILEASAISGLNTAASNTAGGDSSVTRDVQILSCTDNTEYRMSGNPWDWWTDYRVYQTCMTGSPGDICRLSVNLKFSTTTNVDIGFDWKLFKIRFKGLMTKEEFISRSVQCYIREGERSIMLGYSKKMQSQTINVEKCLYGSLCNGECKREHTGVVVTGPLSDTDFLYCVHFGEENCNWDNAIWVEQL